MVNTLAVYDPLFYANETLMILHKSLGMAGRVYRGYDKVPQQEGSVISIRVPSTFTAQDAPSNSQGVQANEVQIALNQWKEVKFSLTDKELTATQDTIIQEHIGPAAYAVSDVIDQSLTALYADIPTVASWSAPAAVSDITGFRARMFNNQVPMNDPSMLHAMVDGSTEADLLSLQAFSQNQGAGAMGVAAQMSGFLGQKYGYNFSANQNVKVHVPGALTGTAAVTGVNAAGVTSIAISAGALTANVKKGDLFTIAGSSANYVVTADAAAAGNSVTVSFSPKLAVATAGSEAVTFVETAKTETLAFHRNAFALAMAPLSEMGDGLGAKIATVTDPVTGLSLRSRVFYNGDASSLVVSIDALYGVKTLNQRLACRVRR